VTPLSQDKLWNQYHFSPNELQKATRIISSKAQYDPTSGVTVDYMPLRTDKCKSRLLYTSDMAHREDLFAPGPTDRKTVVQVCVWNLNFDLEVFVKDTANT
jgi:hypothetical protein